MVEYFKKLAEEAKEYYEVKKKLIRLKAAESASATAGNMIAFVLLFVLGLFALLFFSVTLALGLGWLLHNNFWGFLIVTFVYVSVAALVHFRKEQLIRIPVLNAILKSLFKNESLTDGTGQGNKAA